MRARATLAALVLLLSAAPAEAELYYLIVGGLGGENRYEESFAAAVQSLQSAAQRTVADESRVVVLSGDAASSDALRSAFARLTDLTAEADSLAVFMVGHGSFDGSQYKFNLPGPDIDGAELAALLDAVPARTQLVVNATSASGAVLEEWAADDRTLITATRSGAERNATRFADFWAEALSDDAADLNKNGSITAREAFDYAARKVAESYESQGTLATEHPQLSGEFADRFDVARLVARRADSPRVQALNRQLEELESAVAALRLRREEMPADEYLQQLQELLVQLALVQRQIDAIEAE